MFSYTFVSAETKGVSERRGGRFKVGSAPADSASKNLSSHRFIKMSREIDSEEVPFERAVENTEVRGCEFELQWKWDLHRSKSEEWARACKSGKRGPTPVVPGDFRSVAVALCYFAGMLSNFPEPSS